MLLSPGQLDTSSYFLWRPHALSTLPIPLPPPLARQTLDRDEVTTTNERTNKPAPRPVQHSTRSPCSPALLPCAPADPRLRESRNLRQRRQANIQSICAAPPAGPPIPIIEAVSLKTYPEEAFGIRGEWQRQGAARASRSHRTRTPPHSRTPCSFFPLLLAHVRGCRRGWCTVRVLTTAG